MQLFYVENIESDIYTLPAEESKHVVRVLRMGVGDELFLTDGAGTLCRAAILNADVRDCTVQIVERTAHYQQHPFYLQVAVAPTKNVARLEWFVEKATEAGIDVISPVLCDHSERVHLNEERLDKIAVSAMKQSLKAYKPCVSTLKSFDDIVMESDSWQDGDKPLQKFICYCEGDRRLSLRQVCQKGLPTLVLIGPEGDFSAREVALAMEHGFQAITLGTSRLRTETAALAATFYLNFINE